MDISVIWWVVAGLAVALAAAVLYSLRITKSHLNMTESYLDMKERYEKLESRKKGDDIRRGLMTEQWLPFTESYPWDPRGFKFLGRPIDGIQFEDDRIVLVEFKSSQSHLTAKQRQVRNLVKEGKVEFRVFNVDLKG